MKSNVIDLPHSKHATVECSQKVPPYVRSLAAGLVVAMRVGEGRELAVLIGEGDEYTNQRAIETWLMRHYPDEQLQNGREPIDAVAPALKRLLEERYTSLSGES